MTFGVLLLSMLSPLVLAVHSLPISGGWIVTAGFMFFCKPPGAFDRELLPPKLDYNDDSAWYALPHRADSADIAPCALTHSDDSSSSDSSRSSSSCNASEAGPCGDGQRGHWRIHPQEELEADGPSIPQHNI
jgi:hypothetical protein